MELAPRRVQDMPDYLRREPMTETTASTGGWRRFSWEVVASSGVPLFPETTLPEMTASPVGAMHGLGSRKTKIGEGKRERGGRQGRKTATKLSYGVTERCGAGY